MTNTRRKLLLTVSSCAIALSLSATLMPAGASADEPKDRPGFDLPRGKVSGKLLRQDNKEPIGRQWITLQKRGWSRSTSTDTFGKFELQFVPPGSYTLSFYHGGFKIRDHGPVAVGEDQEVAGIEWVATPVDPQVAPYTYSDTYLPGQNVTIMVRSIRVPSVDVAVFRVPTQQLLDRRTSLLDRKLLTIDPAWKQVLTYRQPVTGGHQLQWMTTQVEPAFDDPGMYVIRVRGAGSEKLIPVLVTRLALVTKRAQDAVWVFATDLETGAPQAGVAVSGEATEKDDAPPASLLARAQTRKDGLVRIAGSHDKNIRYWGVQGESLAYVDTAPASASASLTFRTYVYTDRPAYRPGDSVSYKVITRSSTAGVYRVVPDEEWEVVVRDVEGEVVHRAKHKTNLFGTFSGQLTLGETPALGIWSVEAVSGERRQAGRFKVLEYRKPEYKLDVLPAKKQVVQGTPLEVTFDARYYFGAPLRGAKVSYTVFETPFRPWWYDADYYGAYEEEEYHGYGQVANSGTVALDHEGRATIEVDLDRASIDRWVTIEAVVSDATNREVSARAKVMVTRGTFSVGIRAGGKVFKVGETARFDIEAIRFDGTGASQDVKVTASLERFNTKHKIWIYDTQEARTVRTDTAGKATFDLRVKTDGFIRVEAAGTDEYQNPIVQSTFIWATKDDAIAGGYKKKSLDILSDKSRYEPGQTARVLVNTSRSDPWVLFTVEADGVFEPRVVKLNGNSRLFEVRLTEKHAPNAYLAIAFTAEKSFNSLERGIQISPAHRMVDIDIKADKRTYEPGQTATYDFTVTDVKKKPVQAELSVALVDAAVYAISNDMAPDIASFFYGHRPNPVRTAYSFPSRYLGGADKDEEENGGGVRRDFRDTAFWKAVVQTGVDGKAQVPVPLPDNLTTWRLTVRAVSKEGTLVGQRTHEIQTSKDLISTLALPRFFRRGDRVDVVGMIHNRGEDLGNVKAKLVASGAAVVDGEAARAFDLGAASSQALHWPVDVRGTGPKATLAVFVEGSNLRDAEERSAPVYAVAVDRVEGVSGMSSVPTRQRFEIPDGVIEGTQSLNIRLTASVAGSVMQSLEGLANFPYGCVEQTMSSFLPDLVADKALRDLGIPRSGKLGSLDAMVRKGLRRLYEMQNSEGGWGWWEGDSGHPFMTAYVMYGLARAKRLGWSVRDGVFDRGARAAMEMFGATADPETMAFVVYALSYLPKSNQRDEFLAAALPKVREKAPELTSYSLAALVLAHVEVGRDADAAPLVERLRQKAVVQGGLAYFPGRAWHYDWTDNEKEATAYAVRALLLAAPGDPLVPQGLRWLMAHRRGGMWDTTKDTAAAVETLVAVATRTRELEGDYTARVSINGTEVGTLNVAAGAAISSAAEVPVPVGLLRAGTNDVEIALDGTGTLYWNGELRYGAPPEPRQAGIGVRREYLQVVRKTDARGKEVVSFEPVGDGGVMVGDEIEVRVALDLERPYHYLIIEDPLPAGFEVIPADAGGPFVRRDVRDEKVAFFATSTPKGTTDLSYRLRAEMSGQTIASPAAAWLMYNPQVGGNSGKNVILVSPQGKTLSEKTR